MPPDGAARPREVQPDLLRRLRWPLARALGGRVPGEERSRHRGPGIEYADVRLYQPSDDARQIDWNLTARSEHPYVRESNPERGIDVWFLVDCSRSLDWGTARSLKRDTAHELVSLLSALLAREGSRVAALQFDTAPGLVLPPAAGRRGRIAMLSRLKPRGSAPPYPGRTDLAAALRQAARLIRRPSLVVVVSDFLVSPGWEQPLRALALRHEVVAARVSDPHESELPALGIVTFEDPETGRQVEVDTSRGALRERYRVAALGQGEEITRSLTHARAQVLGITAAAPVLPQVVEFVRRRQTVHA
ncbi:MAG: DUF58 domain-containing protein [Candidatus Dormibacteria bacterium]